MLDPFQFYCRVLCNGMKTRFRMVMIAHPGPGIGFHKRFMWQIIIPPTLSSCCCDRTAPVAKLDASHSNRKRLDLEGNASIGVRCIRSEEHTSELQSRQYLVCRLLLEKKKKMKIQYIASRDHADAVGTPGRRTV